MIFLTSLVKNLCKKFLKTVSKDDLGNSASRQFFKTVLQDSSSRQFFKTVLESRY